jgi:hypothetical protein
MQDQPVQRFPTGNCRRFRLHRRNATALQCGFCTTGFIMSITALLRDNPHPTEHKIREGRVRQLLPVHRLPEHR